MTGKRTVKGYVKKDGTKVPSYKRKKTSKNKKRSVSGYTRAKKKISSYKRKKR